MTITEPTSGRAAIARAILAALPDWFAVPGLTERLARDADETRMFVAGAPDPVGFLALRPHTPAAAEILVLGVVPTHHRQGIGRALVAAAEAVLRAENVHYLTVKTLAATHPSPHFARTRAFYAALGFIPIEVFPTLWGPADPCLMLLKPL